MLRMCLRLKIWAIVLLAMMAPHTFAADTPVQPKPPLSSPPVSSAPASSQPVQSNTVAKQDSLLLAPESSRTPAPARRKAEAPQYPFMSTPIDYVALDQTLNEAIKEITRTASVAVAQAGNFRQPLKGRRFQGTFAQVMDQMSRDFNLFWYTDGNMVYIDSMEDVRTRIVRLNTALRRHDIEDALTLSGMDRYKDHIQFMGSDHVIRISGPDPFLKLVENILAGIPAQGTQSINIIKFGQKVQSATPPAQ